MRTLDTAEFGSLPGVAVREVKSLVTYRYPWLQIAIPGYIHLLLFTYPCLWSHGPAAGYVRVPRVRVQPAARGRQLEL
eukprot:6192268-Pleurochrysis_carterae.AAC.5